MITRYVNTGSTPGGDGTTNATTGTTRAYASLNEFEAAEQCVLSDKMECLCEGASADTARVAVSGWTFTATNYLTIKSSPAGRHAGVWNTDKYRLFFSTTANHGFTSAENYLRVEHIQLGGSTGQTLYQNEGGNDLRVEGCIFKDHTTAGNRAVLRGCSGNRNVFINNIIYGASNTQDGIENVAGTGHILTNNTVYNCGGVGINVSGGSATVQNNICLANGTDFSGGTQSYNISSDATASGTGSLTNRTTTASTNPGTGDWVMFTNITSGSENFHLQDHAENDARDAGTNLTSTFTTDIDGDTRPASGSWDVGADEYVSTGNTLLMDTGSYAVTGNDLTFSRIRVLSLDTGSYGLTGNDLTFDYIQGYVLSLDTGQYNLTGNDLTFSGIRVLSLDTGSYDLVGNDLTFSRIRVLPLDTGSYGLTGNDLTFSRIRVLSLDTGSYTSTGNDITFSYVQGYILSLDTGQYNLTGNDITLNHVAINTLNLDTGLYSITGNDLTFKRNLILPLDTGSYGLTGNDLTLFKSRVLSLDTGSYGLVGNDLTFNYIKDNILIMDTGIYSLNGGDVALVFSSILPIKTYSFNPLDFNFSINPVDFTFTINPR